MACRSSAWRRIGVLGAIFVATAHSQVYRAGTAVFPEPPRITLQRVLAAVSEQPGTLVLLAEPEAGVLSLAKVLTGVELEQTALQRVATLAALSIVGVSVRANGHGGSEVYGHSWILVIGPEESGLQFLNSTGRPEAQLMSAVSAPPAQAVERVRVLPVGAGAVWDLLRRLEAERVVESRIFSPELGVATVAFRDKQSVTIGTLFVEELSPNETRVKVNAITLSVPECLPGVRGKAAEIALFDLIAGGARSRTVAKPGGISSGLCTLLAEPVDFVPLYQIRRGAVRESLAAEAESVWSALLLVVRQLALVTIVDKAKWRIQYEAPCWQEPPPEPREKRFERLAQPRPWCTVSAWLEPQQSSTDVFAGFTVAASGERQQIERLLDKVGEQIFAEERLRYLTQESR